MVLRVHYQNLEYINSLLRFCLENKQREKSGRSYQRLLEDSPCQCKQVLQKLIWIDRLWLKLEFYDSKIKKVISQIYFSIWLDFHMLSSLPQIKWQIQQRWQQVYLMSFSLRSICVSNVYMLNPNSTSYRSIFR